ncbi:MAG TPA: metallophosphoesterase [Candidatus Krumholzibacteria bacterium]|nr:metallophosphoesterase [Candidatus Krumholzibacteria bacterium]
MFAADIHGRVDHYRKLFTAIETGRPRAVFLGGDLLAHAHLSGGGGEFIREFLGSHLAALRARLGESYPRIFVILGNDDPAQEEAACTELAARHLWDYVHLRRTEFEGHAIYGYAFVPPTPFGLKDWERYDVSRYVPPGCVSPEAGHHSVAVDAHVVKYATIQDDLARLAGDDAMERAVLLVHSPPHETALDRAALDGRMIDGVPMDVHVGSIAVRRFIETRQPLLTLHGHVHESARLTGSWRDRIGRTHMFSAAHDGPELALVGFDLDDLEGATRRLL